MGLCISTQSTSMTHFGLHCASMQIQFGSNYKHASVVKSTYKWAHIYSHFFFSNLNFEANIS